MEAPNPSSGLVWSAVSAFLVAPLAWFLKDTISKTKEIEKSLAQTREELARDYATKRDVHGDVDRLIARFDRLEAKMDRFIETRKSQ
jgi:hypothetical protein